MTSAMHEVGIEYHWMICFIRPIDVGFIQSQESGITSVFDETRSEVFERLGAELARKYGIGFDAFAVTGFTLEPNVLPHQH